MREVQDREVCVFFVQVEIYKYDMCSQCHSWEKHDEPFMLARYGERIKNT